MDYSNVTELNKLILFPIKSKPKKDHIRVVIVDPGEEPKIIYIKRNEQFNLKYRTILSNLIYLWDVEWDSTTQLNNRVVLNNVQCCNWKYNEEKAYLNCLVDAFSGENMLIANRIFRYDENSPKLYLAGRAILFKGLTLTNGVVLLKDFDNKELKAINKLLDGRALNPNSQAYLSQSESDSIQDSERYNGEYEKKMYSIVYDTSFMTRTENLGEYYAQQ